MNPVQKTLLGVLLGITIALFAAGHDNPSVLGMMTLVCIFYSIGFIYGWKIILSCASKALHISTDLTLWMFFLCLFRRGWMFGFIVSIFIFSIAIGIGFIAGFFIGMKETIQYIYSDKSRWERKYIFPSKDIDAYLILLGWLSKYNEQNIDEDDLQFLAVLFKEQDPDIEQVKTSLSNENIKELYHAVVCYKRHFDHEETKQKAFALLSSMLRIIGKKGKITCQANEFLRLLVECSPFSWQDAEEYYRETTGKVFPEASDPSLVYEKRSRNSERIRQALRLLGLPDDFDLSLRNASQEIRQAYHKKAMQHHPDRNPGTSGEAMIKIRDALDLLNEAILRCRRQGDAV